MQEDMCPIVDAECSRFITLPNEKILISKRQHWLIYLFFPILFTCIFEIIFLGLGFVISMYLFHSLLLFFAIAILSISATLGIISKILMQWYFHLYIVTSRKILEIMYSPLDALIENEVLLDEVRCTEVDMKTAGIISELLDIGSVTVTFDRPTHQQEFSFSNIKEYRKIGIFLSQHLTTFENNGYITPYQTYWNNQKNGHDKK